MIRDDSRPGGGLKKQSRKMQVLFPPTPSAQMLLPLDMYMQLCSSPPAVISLGIQRSLLKARIIQVLRGQKEMKSLFIAALATVQSHLQTLSSPFFRRRLTSHPNPHPSLGTTLAHQETKRNNCPENNNVRCNPPRDPWQLEPA
jgi:hypothetical protein